MTLSACHVYQWPVRMGICGGAEETVQVGEAPAQPHAASAAAVNATHQGQQQGDGPGRDPAQRGEVRRAAQCSAVQRRAHGGRAATGRQGQDGSAEVPACRAPAEGGVAVPHAAPALVKLGEAPVVRREGPPPHQGNLREHVNRTHACVASAVSSVRKFVQHCIGPPAPRSPRRWRCRRGAG